MTIAELMEAMAAAGAPLEAIIIAVRAVEEAGRAIEQKEAEIAERDEIVRRKRAIDAERKRNERAEERAKRAASADCPRTVRGRGADSPWTPPPNEIYSNPLPEPSVIPDGMTSPAVEIEAGEAEPAAEPIELKPEHVVEAWNDMARRNGLSAVKILNDGRRKKLATRIRQHPIEDWTEAIAAIERSPFLRGENDRGWRADFDFFLEPRNFTKLIEGGYDRTTR